jgi:DNA polymerase-3 subunit gamma/tau
MPSPVGYQVLARKWRPQCFKDMVGQQHVVRALSNALQQNRLHHAYLFTGTRGVGKTTVARIIAKCLNCESGITHEPCEQCSACTEINAGRFIDLIEVDAASRTKVEDTRELLDNVQYAPTKGRFKVYLIDEVHMLSGHSFNALLKTLEEPPPHVKFLLATTDPQKLPMTVLSRCLQFHLKNLTIDQIASQLAFVLEQEQISFESPALTHLGRAADGSMRDALSLLDQAIAHGDGQVSAETVRAMLGSIAPTHLYSIIEALIEENAEALYENTQSLSEHGVDFAQALEELLGLLHQMALLHVLPQLNSSLFADNEKPRELAKQLSAEQLQLYYQIAILGRRDLPLAPTPRSGFEMTLLRMLAFYPEKYSNINSQSTSKPTTPIDQSMKANTRQNAYSASAVNPSKQPSSTSSTAPFDQSTKANTRQSTYSTSAANPSKQATNTSATAPFDESMNSRQSTYSASTAQPSSPSSSAHTSTHSGNVPQNPAPSASRSPTSSAHSHSAINLDDWESILPQLKLTGAALAVAQHCSLQQISEHLIILQVSSGQAPMINERLISRFQESLTPVLGRQVRVEFKVGPTLQTTPAQKQAAAQETRQQQAKTAIHQDKNVQAILNTFGATILPDSVEPAE